MARETLVELYEWLQWNNGVVTVTPFSSECGDKHVKVLVQIEKDEFKEEWFCLPRVSDWVLSGNSILKFQIQAFRAKLNNDYGDIF